jgi:hypothetical protein
MIILAILYGGWPLLTFYYFRLGRRFSKAAAWSAALVALVAGCFIGMAIADTNASLQHSHPQALRTRVAMVVNIGWFAAPYLLVSALVIYRSLQRQRAPNAEHLTKR